MKSIREPERDIGVVAEVDICVIGGSCTGVFAAVRAARLGATVAIVEKQNCFGGTATSGLVNVWHSLHNVSDNSQIIAGLTFEMIQRLESRGGCTKDKDVNAAYLLDTELLKPEMDRLILENSVKPFLHTMYCAPYVKDGELLGVIIENKDGRQAILAKFFIDASGDGDLAHDLGLDNYTHDIMQPPTPTFKLVGDVSGINISKLLQDHGGEFGLPNDWGWGGPVPSAPYLAFRADTHVFDVDCSKAGDLTRAEMEGRKQILAVMQVVEKYAPDKNKDIRIAALCSNIGIRETRHFDSDYRLNKNDLLFGLQFDDAIANGTYRVDIHHTNGGITFRCLNGREQVFKDRISPPIERMWRTDNQHAEYYQVPFKALIQRKFGNLLMAGRMINADSDAFGAVRVMVNLNQIGEAAGVAAFLAVNTDRKIWDINTADLRNTLKNGGSIIL